METGSQKVDVYVDVKLKNEINAQMATVFCILFLSAVLHKYKIVNLTAHLNHVHFTVNKLYLNKVIENALF